MNNLNIDFDLKIHIDLKDFFDKVKKINHNCNLNLKSLKI